MAPHSVPESPQVPAILSLFPSFSAASAGWWPVLLCDHRRSRLQTCPTWAPHGNKNKSAQVRDSHPRCAAVMTTQQKTIVSVWRPASKIKVWAGLVPSEAEGNSKCLPAPGGCWQLLALAGLRTYHHNGRLRLHLFPFLITPVIGLGARPSAA